MNPRKISALFMICTMGLTSTLTAQAVSDPATLFQQLQSHETADKAKEVLVCCPVNTFA
jgi:hypothetical protein